MIISVINTVCQDIELSFGHGTKDWVNLEADEKKLPCVFLYDPVTSSDAFLASGYYDTNYRNITLFFCDKSELDKKPSYYEPILERMRNYQRQFLFRLKDKKQNDDSTPLVKSLANIQTLEIICEFDRNLSGIILTFDVSFYSNDSTCIEC